jgi:allantoate deiminase
MLEELGKVSDERGRLTRTFFSPAMRRANQLVGTWMRQAGFGVREDAVGNLIGYFPSGRPGARTLLLGSHLDTVRDAGRFDGPLGVLLPIVALQEWRRKQVSLPFNVEVLGFSEEEGVRFSSAYLGSKGYTGQLRAADLRLRDAEGISVADVLFGGRRKPSVAALKKRAAGRRASSRAKNLIGYVEVHIEQGPVLEAKKLPVGLVTAIAGQTRGRMTFRGRAGHAGTTPMSMRRDALAGAAEFVLAAEAHARGDAALVATVGTIVVRPGAPNVIPGEAVVSLDVRHPRDSAREKALRTLLSTGRNLARRRKLGWSWEVTQDDDAVNCSPALSALLGDSVEAVAGRKLPLVSGAGHDGVVMSALTDVAMLFVRCREGLSHHPDEYASPADIGIALEVMTEFLHRLAAREA